MNNLRERATCRHPVMAPWKTCLMELNFLNFGCLWKSLSKFIRQNSEGVYFILWQHTCGKLDFCCCYHENKISLVDNTKGTDDLASHQWHSNLRNCAPKRKVIHYTKEGMCNLQPMSTCKLSHYWCEGKDTVVPMPFFSWVPHHEGVLGSGGIALCILWPQP